MFRKKNEGHFDSDAGTTVYPKIEVMEDSHSPARKVVSRSRGRVVGHYPSYKNRRMIGWESQLEQKACAVFEFSRNISSYCEQPATFEQYIEDALVRYTPDFILECFDGSQIYIEVKPLKHLADPILARKLHHFGSYLRELNARLIALTDSELEKEPLQFNLRLLRQYLRVHLPPETRALVVSFLAQFNPISIAELSSKIGSRASVLAMLANGELHFNYQQELAPHSLVSLPQEKDHVDALFSCERTY